jgi:hypothetical protein
MTNDQVLFRMTEKCDICFNEMIISKEQIIKTYIDFFASSLSGDGHSVSVALHTGSVCFEIVAFVMAALLCVSLDDTDAELIITSLNDGDKVIYKNQRYRWRGLENIDGQKYLKLEQDGRGKSGPTLSKIPFETNKGLIKPYYGPSDRTDGRGIRRKNNNRADFISHVFGIEAADVPSVTGVSTVIVTERDTFEHIVKGLSISYGTDKSIGLLDIVTAAYYTDSGEEYQYGNNPAKTEPVLKITERISTARDLVLEKTGNKVIGLMVIGSDAISKGKFELVDLFGRKSLKFAHVAFPIDSECTKEIIDIWEGAALFACTKEFLLQNSLPLQEINGLTLNLERQVRNIINSVITSEIIDGGCSWEDLHKAKEALYTIKKSQWNEYEKNEFMITAYSLINLFITAVFPIKTMEKVVKSGKLRMGITSPVLRIQRLWELADRAKSVDYHCAYVADFLERLYKSMYYNCLKSNALKRHLESLKDEKIAIVVPKAYYADILHEDGLYQNEGITIINANSFNNVLRYDKVIAIGDFKGKRFDPLTCKAAADIIVLLYECETYRFKYRKSEAQKFEKKLNVRTGIDVSDNKFDIRKNNLEFGGIEEIFQAELDLEQYINNISLFDIRKYAVEKTSTGENTSTSEIYAVGRFISGEQILFSKYYTAVIYNPVSGKVVEVGVEDLSPGDLLVFAKRDDYTRNMVDYIYESLQTTGRLSADVLEATEKAAYWKEVLRKYKNKYNLSYRDIAKGLQKFGSTLQEVSIRQWLIEESHIVGPRDEVTLRQVAELTKDDYLLNNTESIFEACRIVRRQRKEILELIGKAITDKLSGYKPPLGSVLQVVYDNVENLSETLELETITLLEEPVTVSINLTNKPLTEWGG